MRINRSRVSQIFYDGFGDPIEVYPRFCIDEELMRVGKSPVMTDGISVLDQLGQCPQSVICFLRTFALGDILLLSPVFNWVIENYPETRILFATVDGFVNVYRYWDQVRTVNKRSLYPRHYDIGYHLDGIVEKDHRGGPESYKHRVDLYCEFLGIPRIKDPVFSLPFSEQEKEWAHGIVGPLRAKNKPVIVMQALGSTHVKQFSLDKSLSIARELSKTSIVILVHNFKEKTNGTEVVNLMGQTNVHQLVALINEADAVVTMDSGVLWVAHCTNTPVIALLGPTREQERLCYHRNYHVVNLARIVNCEPCFERLTGCQGKVRCMTEAAEGEIIEGIRNGINRLVYS